MGGSSAHTIPGHLRTQTPVICTHTSGSSVHTDPGHLRTRPRGGVGGGGGIITFMPSLAQSAWHTQTQEHWGGVGWGNNVRVFFSPRSGVGGGGIITFMSSLAQSAWHTQTQEHWDGVGWDNNVHVCFSPPGGVGGGITRFMSSLAQSAWHTPTQEHWDGVGWDVHVFLSSICLAHANTGTLGCFRIECLKHLVKDVLIHFLFFPSIYIKQGIFLI